MRIKVKNRLHTRKGGRKKARRRPCVILKKKRFSWEGGLQDLKTHCPALINEWKQENISPHGVFRYIWSDEIIDLIVEETNI